MGRRVAVGGLVSLGMCFLLGQAVGAGKLAAPAVSKARAMRQASRFSGFSQRKTVSSTECIVTDPVSEIVPIQRRPVWEVTFEGVAVTVPGPKGSRQKVPALDTVIVWIDARDGALVKLFTPPSKAGGAATPAGRTWRVDLPQLATTPSPPAKSFTAALASITKQTPVPVPQAREVIAYCGREMTAEGPGKRKRAGAMWLVFFGGVKVSVPATGPGDPEAAAATEAVALVDAGTGKVDSYSF